jgi:hypothetical protein
MKSPSSASDPGKKGIAMKTPLIIAAALAALTLSSCGIESLSSAEPTRRAEVGQSYDEWAREVVEDDFYYCGLRGPGIEYETQLSGYTPSNWDDYCDGFSYVYTTTSSYDDACTEFWGLDDSYILRLLMSPEGGSNSRDSSIGMIDGLWTVC